MKNDKFNYSYGLDESLVHEPALSDRGAVTAYYATYHTRDGAKGFIVMSKELNFPTTKIRLIS